MANTFSIAATCLAVKRLGAATGGESSAAAGAAGAEAGARAVAKGESIEAEEGAQVSE